MGAIEDVVPGLENADLRVPFRGRIEAQPRRPGGEWIGGKLRVEEDVANVAVDAVVQVKAVDFRAVEIIRGAEAAELERGFVVPEFLLEEDLVDEEVLSADGLLHVVTAPDKMIRQAKPVAIDPADGELRALPADQFIEVKIGPEIEIVDVGRALFAAADRVAGKDAGVIKEGLDPGVVEPGAHAGHAAETVFAAHPGVVLRSGDRSLRPGRDGRSGSGDARRDRGLGEGGVKGKGEAAEQRDGFFHGITWVG